LASRIRTLKDVNQAGNVLSIILILLSLATIVFYGISSGRVDISGRSNVIWFGRAMGLGIIWFYFGMQNTDDLLKKLTYFIFIIIALFFMNLTGSRGPFLATILTFTLYLLFSQEFSWKIKISIFSFFLILVIYGFTTFFENILGRFTDITQFQSTYLRIYAFSNAFEMFLMKPLFGWGTGSFESLVSEYLKYPHNIFAEIAMELGIIGLFLFIIFVSLNTWYLITLRKKINISGEKILLNTTFMIFIFGFFNAQVSGDIPLNPLMWYAAGSVLSLKRAYGNSI
jgi:O-antigen ligase